MKNTPIDIKIYTQQIMLYTPNKILNIHPPNHAIYSQKSVTRRTRTTRTVTPRITKKNRIT
ncbi:hypothetical protein AHAS_AhasUnG0041300 [Arachis hypogaea]